MVNIWKAKIQLNNQQVISGIELAKEYLIQYRLGEFSAIDPNSGEKAKLLNTIRHRCTNYDLNIQDLAAKEVNILKNRFNEEILRYLISTMQEEIAGYQGLARKSYEEAIKTRNQYDNLKQDYEKLLRQYRELKEEYNQFLQEKEIYLPPEEVNQEIKDVLYWKKLANRRGTDNDKLRQYNDYLKKLLHKNKLDFKGYNEFFRELKLKTEK